VVLLYIYNMCRYVQCVYNRGMAPGKEGNAGEGHKLACPKADMLWE
jgi:hypothetical protein